MSPPTRAPSPTDRTQRAAGEMIEESRNDQTADVKPSHSRCVSSHVAVADVPQRKRQRDKRNEREYVDPC